MAYGVNSYQQNNKTVVSSMTHLLALYKDAIDYLEKARQAQLSQEFEERYETSEKARKILSGLQAAMGRGTPESKETAEALDQFYEGMASLIYYGNIRSDAVYFEKAIKSLSDMRDTFLRFSEEDIKRSSQSFSPESREQGASQGSLSLAPESQVFSQGSGPLDVERVKGRGGDNRLEMI